MGNSIFRQKSIERVSSPEQLNDYIRVTNPATWATLGAVVILLIGLIVWSVAGTLETKVSTVAVSDGGTVTCYVSEAEIAGVTRGDTVRLGGREYAVAAVAAEPVAVDGSFTAYALHIGGFSVGQWVYPVTVNAPLPDGVYEAAIVTDSVSPISFLIN